MKTSVKTLKELLIANMPTYPVKRSYLVSVYGQGVVGALDELMAENKVLRVKRGYYSLSDELLDTYETNIDEDILTGDDGVLGSGGLTPQEFMPTQTLHIILSAWISQFSVGVLIENNLTMLLGELGYYTTESTGDKDKDFKYLLRECCANLQRYRLTPEGDRLRNTMLEGL